MANLQDVLGGNMFGWSMFSGAMFLLIVWSAVWKGMALWRAARRGAKVWFVVLLVVNTVGILEILYLYVFSKRSTSVEHSAGSGQGSAA